jgi:hypothetical protein
MESRPERRGPDRHLVVLRLLRGIAAAALLAAAALWFGPPLLTELGLIGPTAEEYVAAADRAIVVARTYGAASTPAFQRAEAERDRARELARGGNRRQTRQAAQRAMALATDAQREALFRRTQKQRKAEVVYNDLDGQINELEKLYEAVTPGLEKAQVGQLLSVMKLTRQSAGTVFLAYENEDWDTVLRSETRAREVIASARRQLQSARRP